MKYFRAVLAVVFAFTIGVLACSCSFMNKSYEATSDEFFDFISVSGGYAVAAKEGVEMPKNVYLPKTHEGETVVAVADGGFYNVDLESITIPSCIRKIGKGAFLTCASLKRVNVENGLAEIAEYAFGYCEQLYSFDFVKSLKTIGNSAFKGTDLTSVDLTLGVESIGSDAFRDCKNLSVIKIGKQVTFIGENAFTGVNNIADIVISEFNASYEVVDGKIVQKNA